MRNLFGAPEPILAMMREVENLKTRDKNVVTAEYKAKLAEAEKQRIAAAEEKDRLDAEIEEQEGWFNENENIFNTALKACETGDLEPIKKAKERGSETWRLFIKSAPLSSVIAHVHPELVQYLLDNGVDYKCRCSTNPRLEPPLASALTIITGLDDFDEKADSKKKIYDMMVERILKDFIPAAREGQLKYFFDALVDAPKLVNEPVSQQNLTSVMYFAKTNQMKALITINAMRKCKIDFAKQDNFGRSVFDHAFTNGHKELSTWIGEMIELSEIEKACIAGDIAVIEDLITQNHNVTVNNNAPIVWAAMHGHQEVVTKLIATGKVDVTAREHAAIIAAARGGYEGIMQQLIDAGANLFARNGLLIEGAINLYVSGNNKLLNSLLQIDFVSDIVKQKVLAAANTALQELWPDEEIIKLLEIDKSILNAKLPGTNGWTLLIKVARHDRFSLLDKLISLYIDEIDLSVTDKHGKNLIMHLMEAKCLIQEETRKLDNPIQAFTFAAIEERKWDLLEKLLKHESPHNLSPIWHAAKLGNWQIVERLLSYVSNGESKMELAIAMLAIESRQWDIAKKLQEILPSDLSKYVTAAEDTKKAADKLKAAAEAKAARKAARIASIRESQQNNTSCFGVPAGCLQGVDVDTDNGYAVANALRKVFKGKKRIIERITPEILTQMNVVQKRMIGNLLFNRGEYGTCYHLSADPEVKEAMNLRMRAI